MQKEFDTCSVSIDGNGFLYMQIHGKKSNRLDRPDAIEIANGIMEVCQNQPRMFLVDTRDAYGTVTFEAREYFAKHTELAKLRIAEAFVVDSSAKQLIATFYITFHKPPCPTKVFTNFEKALLWLQKFKEQS